MVKRTYIVYCRTSKQSKILSYLVSRIDCLCLHIVKRNVTPIALKYVPFRNGYRITIALPAQVNLTLN